MWDNTNLVYFGKSYRMILKTLMHELFLYITYMYVFKTDLSAEPRTGLLLHFTTCCTLPW